ncbi:copper amine oxidase N-terminal domain-containing protein [Desulfocucumis palustris]|uniref:copper amine oxidase N-terminal domain-containing protein n=1 Tax=Desulfocucumis palustris TaxID=1898651 RepID=UPI000CE9D769|nr:copper amine oxidase N-terminal domain-containing protein [Desulfocucumis palustris]
MQRRAIIAFVAVIILALFTINLKYIAPTPAHAEESDKHDVIFTLGKTTYTVDGREKELDVAPYAKNGRTYIPVRYLAQALGAKVQWDEESQTVWLTKDKRIRLVVGSSVLVVNDRERFSGKLM